MKKKIKGVKIFFANDTQISDFKLFEKDLTEVIKRYKYIIKDTDFIYRK